MSEEKEKPGFGTAGEFFTDDSGHTIKAYPGEVDGGFLLGIDDWGGWYYDPLNGVVRNYGLEAPRDDDADRPSELTVNFTVDPDEYEDEYEGISSLAADLVDRTVFGHSMVLADQLSEAGFVLTEAQAKVYALRDVYNVGRRETATVLDKSANTVDNQRAKARQKVDEAQCFVGLLDTHASD
jgi:Sigma-70, region 4.